MKRALVLATAILVSCFHLSFAETSQGNAEDGQATEESSRKPGFYAGSIRLLPKIDISEYYNDNIYATDSGRVSDYITVVKPNLVARTDWEEHSVRVELGAEVGDYWDNTEEDYEDYWADIKGRYDFSPQTNVFGGVGYSYLHESRDSPDSSLGGVSPTLYQSKNAHLGLSHSLENYSFRVGGTLETLDFDDVPTLFGGTVENDYRDRTLYGLGGRASRNMNETTDLFVQLLYDKRDYSKSQDPFGFNKDSDGYRAALGIKKALTGLGSFEISAGILTQDYRDSRFDDIDKPDYSGALTLFPSARSKFTANLDRGLYETTQAGSSGYLYTSLSSRFEYRLLPKLSGHLHGSYGLAEYQDTEREDDNYSAGLGLKYQISPNIFLAADYRRLERDSNDEGLGGIPSAVSDDFDQNLFFLTLGVSPYPKSAPLVSGAAVEGEVELGAIYVNDGSLWFGNYTGLEKDGFHALANLDFTAKWDDTSRTRLVMEDMGLDTRSILLSWSDSDKFKTYASWDELRSYQYPAKVIFGGVKSPNLTVPDNWFDNSPINTTQDMDQLSASLQSIDMGTKRKQLGFGGRLKLKNSWTLDGSFKSVRKEGLETLGGAIGTSPGNTRVALLPEPVDWKDHQLDFSLNRVGKSGQFDIAYHGSFFENQYDSLQWESPFSGVGSARYTEGRLALAPENQFHQVSVSGDYLLSQSTRTRLSGVYSYGLMLQDDDFLSYTINPLGASNPLPEDSLDGKVVVQDAVIKLASQPFRKLRLNAAYRLNDRDNKTDQETFDYVTGDSNPSSTTSVRNKPYGYKKETWNLDAKYRLHRKADLVLGYDNDRMKREHAERRRTDEDTYRAELRTRPMDRVQASLNFARSERDGSNYDSLPDENPLLRKYNMADRDRDAGGVKVTYLPWDQVSISASANKTKDDFDDTQIGLKKAKSTNFAIDSSVQFSEEMSAYAFYNWESIKSDQAGSEAGSTPDWTVDYEDKIQSVGVGLKKTNLLPKLDISVDYVYSDAKGDRDLSAPASITSPEPFPDLSTKIHTVKVSADYRFKKRATFRLSYLYEKYSSDDWAVDDVYPDTLRNVLTIDEQAPHYSEHVVSASVSYKF